MMTQVKNNTVTTHKFLKDRDNTVDGPLIARPSCLPIQSEDEFNNFEDLPDDNQLCRDVVRKLIFLKWFFKE